MEYIKLIALKIDDFHSSIFFEDNYAVSDMNEVEKQKEYLEKQGYHCVVVKMNTNLVV